MVYVDGLLVATVTKREDEQTMEAVRSYFANKGRGKAPYCLACHFTRGREVRTLKLEQHRYVQNAEERFGVKETSVISAPTEGKLFPNKNALKFPPD